MCVIDDGEQAGGNGRSARSNDGPANSKEKRNDSDKRRPQKGAAGSTIVVENLVEQTVAAMRAGREVIYQGALQLADATACGDFAGRSDFLIKVPGASELGDFHYEVWDTKFSRKPRPYFLIQLCCYAEMLEVIQGKLPQYIGIVLGDTSEKRFRTQDYLYYYRQLKQSFLEMQANFKPVPVPMPNGMANHGKWTTAAESILEDADHLCRVANIRSVQIKKLEKAGIATMKGLATTRAGSIPKMEPKTFATLKTQARLQVESAGWRFRSMS